jgi:hypothetical protein
MSLFDSASLVVTPNGVKEGKLYSIKPTDGSGDLVVTRATTATRVNSAGLVELVPYNLFEYSEQFDNSFWTKNDCSVSANAIAAPNGTLTADKLVENSSNSVHLINTPNNSVPTGSNTLSVYAKADTRNWILLYLFDGVLGSLTAYFNVSNGTLGTIASGLTASIDSVGNGWYRCSITRTQANAGNGGYGLASADNVASYTGNGTSGAYFWGGQLVAGTSAKDYLKTETRLNIPRLDYTNGTCPSILVEPQRTNLSTYSEDLGNASWEKYRAIITDNVINSPSGILNADKFIATANNGTHEIVKVTVVGTSTVYTRSIFAKVGEYNTFEMYEINSAKGQIFNLATKTISAPQTAGISAATSAKIEDYGNGWLKCSMTYTSVGLADILVIGLYNGSLIFTGNGTSGLYLWGAQLEAGSYATSYIPTVASSVTRNADLISKTGISSLIGQTEGTIFVNFVKTHIQDESLLLMIYDNSNVSGKRLQIVLDSNHFLFYAQKDPSFALGTPNIPIANGNHKIAVSYGSNGYKVYLNGVSVYTNASAVVPETNSFNLGSFPVGVVPISDGIKIAGLFKRQLTNSELETLTTI